MELRQLTTDCERRIFGDCLAKARATRGVGFRETAQSRFAMAHLMFGNVYAIFENDNEPVERMLGGFIVHDLATLPQSFPKPDLSDLPGHAVIEGSELWSLSRGTAGVARRIAPVIAGVLQVKAILLYPMVQPLDQTEPHLQVGYTCASEPMVSPYAQTLEGGPVWVQPMILQGEKLEAYVRWGFQSLFTSGGDRLTLRFDKPASSRPAASQTPASIADSAGATSLSAESRTDSLNANRAVAP
jgi:hypothetical protein